MKSFEEIEFDAAAKIKYILCDIDDTITTNGKLSAQAYTALWRLHDAGYEVIPVTGRPAGWCDMIVRQWPVRAVIGENGAFVYYFKQNRLLTFIHPSVASGDIQGNLQAVKEACLQKVPGCRVSKDQFSRIYDVAIDFNEDPPYLGLDAAERIRAVCESMGATVKISSIHVNTWFGNYSKVDMSRLFLENILHALNIQESVLFFGDSPNDEPMFAFFPMSCGVANIKPFADQLEHLPAFVAELESGDGFTQSVHHFLRLLGK